MHALVQTVVSQHAWYMNSIRLLPCASKCGCIADWLLASTTSKLQGFNSAASCMRWHTSMQRLRRRCLCYCSPWCHTWMTSSMLPMALGIGLHDNNSISCWYQLEYCIHVQYSTCNVCTFLLCSVLVIMTNLQSKIISRLSLHTSNQCINGKKIVFCVANTQLAYVKYQ